MSRVMSFSSSPDGVWVPHVCAAVAGVDRHPLTARGKTAASTWVGTSPAGRVGSGAAGARAGVGRGVAGAPTAAGAAARAAAAASRDIGEER